MLERVFQQVISMSRAAGIMIVIVCIARILLKRFPKYISYLLWSVVLFRLFCPVTWESKISPIPSLKPALTLCEYAGRRRLAGRAGRSAA